MSDKPKDEQKSPSTKRRRDDEPDKRQDEAELKDTLQRLLGREENPYSQPDLLILVAGLIGDGDIAKDSVIGLLQNWKGILGRKNDCNHSSQLEYCEIPGLTHLTPETIGDLSAHHGDKKAFSVKAEVSPDQLMTFIEAYGVGVEFLCFCKAVDSDGKFWLNDGVMGNILIFCPKLRYINLANCGSVTWQPFLAYFIRECKRLPEIGVGYGLDTQLTQQNFIRAIAPQLQSALGLM